MILEYIALEHIVTGSTGEMFDAIRSGQIDEQAGLHLLDERIGEVHGDADGCCGGKVERVETAAQSFDDGRCAEICVGIEYVRVVADATIESVNSAAAFERVVASATDQRIRCLGRLRARC